MVLVGIEMRKRLWEERVEGRVKSSARGMWVFVLIVFTNPDKTEYSILDDCDDWKQWDNETKRRLFRFICMYDH